MSKRFDLTQNPFAILGVSPRTPASGIADAKSDCLFDSDHDELVLEDAQSELIVERKRLAHEISWLTDTAPNKARELVSNLSTLTQSSAESLLDEGGQLSRMNLAADLLSRFPKIESFATQLIDAFADANWGAIRQNIEESRALSGFSSINDADWKKAQSNIIDLYSAALVHSITMRDDGPEFLSALQTQSAANGVKQDHRLLDRVVTQYDRWSVPHLERLSEKIDISLAALKQVAEIADELTRLENLLADWDRLSQPVQLRDQFKGLDEPRSLRLFKKVREVAIWFANERENPEAARRISEAFASAFAELPTVAATTKSDIQTLDENIEAATVGKLLSPLQQAVEAACGRLPETAKQVLAGNFRAGKKGIVGTLFSTFEQATKSAESLPNPSLPWLMVRGVALDLHNESVSSPAAQVLTEEILKTAPDEAKEVLADDLSTLRSINLQNKFGKSLESGDLSGARAIISSMIDGDPDERPKLIAVRNELDSRIKVRNLKRVGWGIAAVVAVIFIANENNQQTASTSGDYDIASDSYDTANYEAAEATTEDSAPSTDDKSETPPPMYNASPLTLSQLRFCKFEMARLERLQDQIDNSMADKFNPTVDEYNSRCGRFRADPADVLQIDAEVAAGQAKIRSQVAKIISSWTVTPISPPAASNFESETSETPPREAFTLPNLDEPTGDTFGGADEGDTDGK